MNDLSILLYLADIFNNLSTALGATSIFAAITSLFTTTAYFMMCCDAPSTWRAETKEQKEQIQVNWNKNVALLKTTTKYLVIGFVVAGGLSLFMPSKDTMYAIAVSEVGEEVVKSETAGKAVKALNNWLDEQIKPDTQTENKGE